MSKTLDWAGKGIPGVDGEAEANNSKALSEQGQQNRGKPGEEITAEVSSPGPNWGLFNPFMDKYTEWEQVALVSPATTREEGTEPVHPTWFSIPAVVP